MTTGAINRHIAVLVYKDIEAAIDYFTRVFGFGPSDITQDPDGNVVHGEIRTGSTEFWLHPESTPFGLGSPSTLGGASATMAVMVDDVDAHHQRALSHDATISYDPTDQPYGYREYGVVDPEGHLWSFMQPLSPVGS